MSWWFSKKKSSPSTPPETTAANIPNSEGDDFIFVERKSSLKPNLDDSNPRPTSSPLYPPILPYSLDQTAPGLPPTHGNTLNRQDSLALGPHMLHEVPFKLTSSLDSGDNEYTRQYTELANEVLFYISQLDLKFCDHDFSLENSVLQELGINDGE